MSSRRTRQPSLVARLRDALRADDVARSQTHGQRPPDAPGRPAPQAQAPPEPASRAGGAPDAEVATARDRAPRSRRWRWELRSPRVRWGAVRRQAWIPLLGALALGAGGYLVSTAFHRPFSAGTTLLVDSGARSGTPGDASDATVLAPTLATAIREDAYVRAAVAAATGRSLTTVGSDIAASSDDGQTALVRIRYRDASASAARSGAKAIVRAASSPGFAAGTLGGRSPLVAVAAVRAAERTDPVTPALTATLGALLGLFLGLALALMRERRRPRVDDLADLERATGCAASRLDLLGPRSCAALLDRWCEPARDGRVTVALVPANTQVQRRRPDVASELVSADAKVPRFAWSGRGHDDLELRLLPAVRGAGHAPLLSVDEDVSVVVVTPGTPVADVRATAALLGQLELPPAWALLVRRRGKGSSTPRDGGSGARSAAGRSETAAPVPGDPAREPVG